MDEIVNLLDRGETQSAMRELFSGLLAVRNRRERTEWRQFISEAMEHPIRKRIHSDPMTRRSYEKPRGYAGDAVLLDYIYGILEPDSPDARGVYRFATSRPAASAVRSRRERIAQLIDAIAADRGRPIRVLSIAAGHLREAELTSAFGTDAVSEFVALDADSASCAFLRETFPDIEVINRSFTSLFRVREYREHFDFVYSAGLFDYLDERLAKRLTRCMFDCLAPGGKLFLTNFLPTTPDAGYMESFMGWDLIYRSEDEIRDLASEIAPDRIGQCRVYPDDHASIGYLEIDR